MRSTSVLTLLAFLAGCGAAEDENRIALDWSTGDTFHVAARYRVAEAKTEEIAVGLEDGDEPTFGDHWTDEVIWTYQVVETGYVPGSSDELFEYALDHDDADEDVAKPISVVRAWIDDSLNDDTELLAADPVVYLVFREDRDRLAAVVQFLNIDGERVEKAWHSSELGKSWSALSQSMVTALPTYLAPFGTHFADEDRITENGSTVSTERVDADTVDAYYDDEVGGGLVMNRYVRGQKWPVWTASENVEARLLSDADIIALRGALPFLLPEPPEDYDYLGALASSIDIDAALKLDDATMSGGFEASAPEGYAPWAGSWWPQSQGALVFGYDDRETISGRIREEIDPLKERMSAIGDELRAMDEAGEENDPKYDELMLEYRTKLNTLRQTLRSFYDGVRADIDGGKLTVKSGRIDHTDGWGYSLNSLSPFDKFALQRQLSGTTSDNPWRMQEWEILNHYTPGGGSWWGHCNGWSGAAILTNEPKRAVSTTVRGETMQYTTADIKGLLTEAHYSTVSRFYGERYNGKENDIGDLSPKAFTIIASHYLRDRQVPLVFDTTANEEVWNFPAYAVDLSVRETTANGGARKVNINTATVAELEELPEVGKSTAKAIVAYRKEHGAFQSVDDLANVTLVGSKLTDRLRPLITIDVHDDAVQRTFAVTAKVSFATDGVAETHVDSGEEPEGFVETWSYTLTTDANGTVTGGTWNDNEKHPDFAWVPYDNPTRNFNYSTTENPNMQYGELLKILGDGVRRR